MDASESVIRVNQGPYGSPAEKHDHPVCSEYLYMVRKFDGYILPFFTDGELDKQSYRLPTGFY